MSTIECISNPLKKSTIFKVIDQTNILNIFEEQIIKDIMNEDTDLNKVFNFIIDNKYIKADYVIPKIHLTPHFDRDIKNEVIKQFMPYLFNLGKYDNNIYYQVSTIYKKVNIMQEIIKQPEIIKNCPTILKKEIILDYENFKNNLKINTDDLLQYIPLSNNVILSGGTLYDIATSNINNNFMDLDIFATKNVGNSLVSTIINNLVKANKVCYAYNKNKIHYIFVQGSNRLIQIIYTDFENVEQIINSFDSSHTMMYYDGKELYAKGLCINGLLKYKSYYSGNKPLRMYKIIMRNLKVSIKALVWESHSFMGHYSMNDHLHVKHQFNFDYNLIIKEETVTNYIEKQQFFNITDIDKVCKLYNLSKELLMVFVISNSSLLDIYFSLKRELEVIYGKKDIIKHKQFPIYYPDIIVNISGVISFVYDTFEDDFNEDRKYKPIYISISDKNMVYMDKLEEVLENISNTYACIKITKRAKSVANVFENILIDNKYDIEGCLQIRVNVLNENYASFIKGNNISIKTKMSAYSNRSHNGLHFTLTII